MEELKDDKYQRLGRLTRMNKKDFNYKLVEMLSETLKQLNNYDYCTHLKRKYKIDDFSIVNVYNIIIAEKGIEDLYYHLANLIDNEHLQYLNEISLIDSESYQNIEDKILPELKKRLNQKENNNKNVIKNIKSKEER